MVIRLGLLVAASIAAYAVKQLNIKSSRSSTLAVKPSGTRFYESYVYMCVCVCVCVCACACSCKCHLFFPISMLMKKKVDPFL